MPRKFVHERRILRSESAASAQAVRAWEVAVRSDCAPYKESFSLAIFIAKPFRVIPRIFAARDLFPLAVRSASRMAWRSTRSSCV